MTGAVEVEGTSRLISYSSSKQINRVNGVSLTGLTAGSTYYYQVGDGSVWSDVRSFTVPAAEKQTRFFLLADIQEEAALEGMAASPAAWAGSITSASSWATQWITSATTTSGRMPCPCSPWTASAIRI